MLVYSENGLVDPWLLSQSMIEVTERLIPLVAVQPLYMHPYAVAKMVASIAYLHGRRVALNLVAGGFKNDLLSLGDETPHDERYARLLEYAEIIRHLSTETKPLTHDGSFYRVHELRLQPPVPAHLAPSFMISGSSAAGLEAARALGATAVRYPHPAGEEQPLADDGLRNGIRIGIIARDDREEAWRVAYERFPEDRDGQIIHHLAMGVSDSHWHAQLSRLALGAAERNVAYWLRPFQNYQAFCPYLVGDFATVAAELASYMQTGFRTFILDIAPSQAEIENAARAFALATELSR
jgi:alkanesulfonate monooxygenase